MLSYCSDEEENMYYGALEAGGTKMVCAIGDENKNIIDRISIPTDTPDQSVPVLIDYFKKHNISSLGIGTFGPANVNQNSPSYGTILKSPKKAWEGFNFYKTFSEALKRLVVVDTDVNAAAWGEFLFGALKGLHSGMYLTIGTGIGGGVIADGHLIHGMMHPETGHILIPRRDGDDTPCSCRFHQNCAEGLAAGPMLERRTGMKGKDIPADSPVWDLEAYYIAEALVNYTMCYSVERIGPARIHTRKVAAAMAITAGTKIPETLSAILAIGALVAAASLTIWMILERAVSSPTLTASQVRTPD